MIIICSNCGNRKRRFREKCSACGFKPKTDNEQAEALLLSDHWHIQKGMNSKDAKEQIITLQKVIKNKAYEKKEDDINAAKEYLAKLAVEERHALFRVLKFISPLFLVIALAVIVFMVRHCS